VRAEVLAPSKGCFPGCTSQQRANKNGYGSEVYDDDITTPATPGEASRKGLEENEPHRHATTQHDKPTHPKPYAPEQTDAQRHKGGPLPNVRK